MNQEIRDLVSIGVSVTVLLALISFNLGFFTVGLDAFYSIKQNVEHNLELDETEDFKNAKLINSMTKSNNFTVQQITTKIFYNPEEYKDYFIIMGLKGDKQFDKLFADYSALSSAELNSIGVQNLYTKQYNSKKFNIIVVDKNYNNAYNLRGHLNIFMEYSEHLLLPVLSVGMDKLDTLVQFELDSSKSFNSIYSYKDLENDYMTKNDVDFKDDWYLRVDFM